MKKEVLGFVWQHSDGWIFENDTQSYSSGIPSAIDELLGIETKDGEKYKITIEKL